MILKGGSGAVMKAREEAKAGLSGKGCVGCSSTSYEAGKSEDVHEVLGSCACTCHLLMLVCV
jgi:hypothetical protein